MKLLIVDDDDVDRMVLQRALRTLPYDTQVREARDGAEALQALRSETFDCIFLDFLLPDSDGLAMLETIRAEGIQCPVIVLTGQGDEQLAVELMRSGAADYLSKDKLTSSSICRSVSTVTRYHEAKLKQIQTEEALRQSETLYRTLIETIPYGIQESDGSGIITFSNRAHQQLLGHGEEEILGRPAWEFLDGEEERARLRELIALAVRDEPPPATYRSRCRTRDGALIDIEVDWNYKRDSRGAISGFISVITDITKRLQAERDIKLARDAALESARLKSAFLANMSHEIRTPMNGVLGMLSLLRGTPLAQEQQEYLDNAYHSGEALLTIINDILDFSKIEAGKLHLEKIDFNVRQVMEEVAELLAEQAHRKGLELVCDIPSGCPATMRGDPGRLRQIITNLVSNAIKFTREGEVIFRVSGWEREEGRQRLRFEVQDSGIGIPPEKQLRLFQSFSQADGSTTREYGGTGLGLAISKQLAELMGGEIGLESLPGKGSRFWFTTCFEQAAAEVQAADPQGSLTGLKVVLAGSHAATAAVVRGMVEWWGGECHIAASADAAMAALESATPPCRLALLDGPFDLHAGLIARIRQDPRLKDLPLVQLAAIGRCATGDPRIQACLTKPLKRTHLYRLLKPLDNAQAAQTPAAPPGAGPLRGRVLVVEDNLINQKVATGLLKRLGCETDLAANGLEALEAIRRTRYDLVLMDCQMPQMDGFEAARLIRQQERTALLEGQGGANPPRLPIVALTANAMEGDAQKCLDAGMDEHLAKPINNAALQKTVERWLPGSQPSGGAAPLRSAASELAQGLDQLEIMTRALGAANRAGATAAARRLEEMAMESGAARLAQLCNSLILRCEQGQEEDGSALLAQLKREYRRGCEGLPQFTPMPEP